MTRRPFAILPALLLAAALPAGAEEPASQPAKPPAPEAGMPAPEATDSRGTEEAAAPSAGSGGEANLSDRSSPGNDSGPSLGMPGRTDPAASRGPSGCPTRILALAPAEGVGLTTHESPVLRFSLDEATACRIEFVLNDPRQTAPSFEWVIPGPHAAGIHDIDLREHGARLEPGVVYSWYVQIVPDPDARSKDIFSGAPIQRITAADDDSWYDLVAARQLEAMAGPHVASGPPR